MHQPVERDLPGVAGRGRHLLGQLERPRLVDGNELDATGMLDRPRMLVRAVRSDTALVHHAEAAKVLALDEPLHDPWVVDRRREVVDCNRSGQRPRVREQLDAAARSTRRGRNTAGTAATADFNSSVDEAMTVFGTGTPISPHISRNRALLCTFANVSNGGQNSVVDSGSRSRCLAR